MSTNLEDFLPYVLPWARGAAEPAVEHALRDAAIEYCEKTHVWREWLDPQTLTAGTDIVSFTIVADAEIYRLEEIWLNRQEICPITEDEIRQTRYIPGDVGAPVAYSSDTPGVIRLVPIPAQDYVMALRARVTLVPSRTATTLPDFLFKLYAREIADGALSRLHASTENYAVPGSLQLYAAKWSSAIDHATSQAARSNTKALRRARASYN